MRDAGREGAGRSEAFRLEQRIEHLAALSNVAQDHLDELFFAEGDERGVDVEKKRPDWKFRSLGRSLAENGLEAFDNALTLLLGDQIREAISDDLMLRLALLRFHFVESERGRVEPGHDPRVRLDFVHRVRRMIDGVAIFLFRL